MADVIDMVSREPIRTDPESGQAVREQAVLAEVGATAVSCVAANLETAEWLMRLAKKLSSNDSAS